MHSNFRWIAVWYTSMTSVGW